MAATAHSAAHKREIEAVDAIRARMREVAVTQEEAKAAGFKPVTQGWSLHRYEDVFELDVAVKGLGDATFKLVLAGSRIQIWRKK